MRKQKATLHGSAAHQHQRFDGDEGLDRKAPQEGSRRDEEDGQGARVRVPSPGEALRGLHREAPPTSLGCSIARTSSSPTTVTNIVDGAIVVHDAPEATDKGACKALGVNWDDCVLWVGLPVMCQDGTEFGLVGSINYDAQTGAIVSLDVTQGQRPTRCSDSVTFPVSMIKGFRYGMGAEPRFHQRRGKRTRCAAPSSSMTR